MSLNKSESALQQDDSEMNEQHNLDTSEEAVSEGSEDRWDPNLLEDMDYKNVFVEEGEPEDTLPDFFDVNVITSKKQDWCYLCQAVFKLSKKRYFCKACGKSCCDMCS
jgi:hypothetical protein